jgi:hypothetical protein
MSEAPTTLYWILLVIAVVAAIRGAISASAPSTPLGVMISFRPGAAAVSV